MANALALLTRPRSRELALFAFEQATGVDAVEVVTRALVNTVLRVAQRAHGIDAAAVDEMVAMMRADAPVLSGRLYNGISGEIVGGVAEVSASAVKPKGGGGEGADYAPFVESGTKAGSRGMPTVADEAYFTREEWFAAHPGSASVPGKQFRSGRTLRRVHHPHPGTPAQPFFWDNARTVLARRGVSLEEAMASAVADEGWETR